MRLQPEVGHQDGLGSFAKQKGSGTLVSEVEVAEIYLVCDLFSVSINPISVFT